MGTSLSTPPQAHAVFTEGIESATPGRDITVFRDLRAAPQTVTYTHHSATRRAICGNVRSRHGGGPAQEREQRTSGAARSRSTAGGGDSQRRGLPCAAGRRATLRGEGEGDLARRGGGPPQGFGAIRFGAVRFGRSDPPRTATSGFGRADEESGVGVGAGSRPGGNRSRRRTAAGGGAAATARLGGARAAPSRPERRAAVETKSAASARSSPGMVTAALEPA